MTEVTVGRESDIGRGDRVVVEAGGLEVAVFNVDGDYYAYPNWCPHQGGPLCEGSVDGTTAATFDPDALTYDLEWVKDGGVLRCPWHQWEFDIAENRFLHDGEQTLPSYPVTVEDGDVVVSV